MAEITRNYVNPRHCKWRSVFRFIGLSPGTPSPLAFSGILGHITETKARLTPKQRVQGRVEISWGHTCNEFNCFPRHYSCWISFIRPYSPNCLFRCLPLFFPSPPYSFVTIYWSLQGLYQILTRIKAAFRTIRQDLRGIKVSCTSIILFLRQYGTVCTVTSVVQKNISFYIQLIIFPFVKAIFLPRIHNRY